MPNNKILFHSCSRVTLWLVLLNLYVEHQLLPNVYFAFIPFWILIISLLLSVTREIFVVSA